MPDFVEPMLATLRKSPAAGERWLHEIKFDGYRLQARIKDGRRDAEDAQRSRLDRASSATACVEALAGLPAREALIDGELVVENGGGASDFSALQADLSAGRTDRFIFYAFDLLHLDGFDLRATPLVRRKALLETIIGAGSGALRFSGHFDESGALVLRHACRLGLEGVVSKLRDSPYRSGRARSWIKSKCSARQEFVVAGFVPSTTTRGAIGSLVLGVYEKDALHYVGRVGTGFSAATAKALHARLEPMRIQASPFANRLSAEEARQVRFVRPELAAEVDFRAWTADGLLRHASFRALRDDKPAREIVREAASPDSAPKPQRRTVALTHPDRIYWPDRGVTKEGLADYYADVWPHMAPFVVGRPLALLRCPNGIDGPAFFQKHAWKGINRNIVLADDPKEPGGEPLVSIRDLDGLMGLVQAAALEIHPWGSTLTDWERPDTITIDLDPGDDVPWTATIEAAREVRERLKEAGLAAFVKTSGGKGLHVVAPVKPKAEWPAAKAFTKAIAEAMAADSPALYVATIAKAKRHGKILIDYLRNQRGMTAVAAYSPRARPGAAVSMPLGWDELGPEIGPAYFTIDSAPARLASLADDPWKGFRAAAAPIESRKGRGGRSAALNVQVRGRPGRLPCLLSAATLLRRASMMLMTLLGAGSASGFGRAASACALPLFLDDLHEPRLDRVADHVRTPGLLALLDQLGDQAREFRIELGLGFGVEIVARVAHFLAVAQCPKHDAVVAGLQHDGAFAALEDQAGQARHSGRAHRIANDAVSLRPDGVIRRHIIGRVVPYPVHAIGRRETLDVDCSRAFEIHRLRSSSSSSRTKSFSPREYPLTSSSSSTGLPVTPSTYWLDDPVSRLAVERMKADLLVLAGGRRHRDGARHERQFQIALPE